jgi:hypothetical protein
MIGRKENQKYANIYFIDDLNQESLIAEAEAKSLLPNNLISIYSSGSLVKFPKGIRFGRARGLMSSYLDSAVQQEIINKKYIDSIIKKRDLTSLKEFLKTQQFIGQTTLASLLNDNNLSLANNEKLSDYLNLKRIKHPFQTIATPGEKNLVIAMSNSAYERVKQINSGTGNPPIITEMKYFAGLTYDIPNLSFIRPNTKNDQDLEAAQKIISATKLVLERILN